MSTRKTARSMVALSKLAMALGLGAVALAMSSTAPAGAALPAHSAEVDSESAANMVYKVVKSKYSKQLSGRTLETSCSPRQSTFACSWWIIKKSSERPRKCLRRTSPSITARSGEGSLHGKYCYVYKAGSASATYNSKKRAWVVVA